MQDHLVDIRRKITLHQNEPDPFDSATVISFTLRSSGVVTLTILNLQGLEIKTLLHEWRAAGEHRIEFSGLGYPEGLYICRLGMDGVHNTRTMLLLRRCI